MQEDALFATMTPSEAIFFSGRLRTNLTEGDLSTNVTFLMSKLGLDKCSNTFIGNELVKGLSGGQRKLTSVAVELIAHPMVIDLVSWKGGNNFCCCRSCSLMNQPPDWIHIQR